MGRTVPTFRMILEHVISDWRAFRRALRVHDRDTFDRMMTRGRQHAAAASNAARLNPTESLFMAILLEHEIELEALKNKIRHKHDRKYEQNDSADDDNRAGEAVAKV